MDKHSLDDLVTNGLPRSNVSLLHALNSRKTLDKHNMSDGEDPIIEPCINEGVNFGFLIFQVSRKLVATTR